MSMYFLSLLDVNLMQLVTKFIDCDIVNIYLYDVI